MSNRQLAFLGGGNMGRALIGGLLRRGTRPEHISVGESSQARARPGARLWIQATADNAAAVESASVVVVAVKPQDRRQRAHAATTFAAKNPTAGYIYCRRYPHRGAGKLVRPGVPVVRAMPNRPALVGAGATGLFAPAHVGPTRSATPPNRSCRPSAKLFGLPPKTHLDVVTALSGSGPAYFFLLAELLTQGGIDLGLEPARGAPPRHRDAARRGSTRARQRRRSRANASGSHLQGRNDRSGGESLDAADLRGIVARALEAATRRSRELAAAIRQIAALPLRA